MHGHHVYKAVELVGSSPNSIEDAIKSAIARANATLRNLRWFEVVETRGHIEKWGSSPLPGDTQSRIYIGG